MNNLDSQTVKDLQTIKDDYKRALKLVEILFKDKKDKEGKPYINHLIRVSSKLSNYNTKVAGLLHDTIEDIPNFTYDDLRNLNFNETIIELVRLVTKDKKNIQSYHNRITKLIKSNNLEALKLKLSDIQDNCDLNRLAKLDEPTRKRLYNKYKDELERLKNILKEKGEKL